MGYKWTVETWRKDEDGNYRELEDWAGQSAVQAFLQFRKARKIAKKEKYGCVSLRWRG